MKKLIQIILVLTIIVTIISGYWSLISYTDVFQNSIIEKWSHLNPWNTLIRGIISIVILLFSLIFLNPTLQLIKLNKTLIITFCISFLFIFLASFAWFDSWTSNPTNMPDSRELGDSIWKLGHPLTFLIIDLPIFLRRKYTYLQVFWSDIWAFPVVLILFFIQIAIYVHGFRMILNFKKLKNLYFK